jgi:hypothetical protein
MFENLVKSLKALAAWVGATIATNTDTTSTVVIDTQGYEPEVMFAVYSGTITDGSYVLEIRETDNSDGTTGAAEVGSYLHQDTFAATEDNAVQKVGARLSKRYCTLNIASTGTTTGGVFKGAIAVLSPKARPVT